MGMGKRVYGLVGAMRGMVGLYRLVPVVNPLGCCKLIIISYELHQGVL